MYNLNGKRGQGKGVKDKGSGYRKDGAGKPRTREQGMKAYIYITNVSYGLL